MKPTPYITHTIWLWLVRSACRYRDSFVCRLYPVHAPCEYETCPPLVNMGKGDVLTVRPYAPHAPLSPEA